MTSAQDQSLKTKYLQIQIPGINPDSKYRICKETNEALSHLLNMRPILTTSNYLKRHNNVAAILHGNICENYGTKTSTIPLKHHPEPAIENNEGKVLWDFEIRTYRLMPARRPDIVVIMANYYNNRKFKDREDLEILNLRIEIRKLSNTKAKVISIIVGLLGPTSMNFWKFIEEVT